MDAEESSNAEVLVIDLGSGLVKAGWAGEDAPRSVQASLVATLNDGEAVGQRISSPDEPEEMVVGDEALSALARYPSRLNALHPIER
jgi:actin-related protein